MMGIRGNDRGVPSGRQAGGFLWTNWMGVDWIDLVWGWRLL